MSRSNFLKENEKKVQEKWGRTAFEANAPEIFDLNNNEKFFVTFPFPYSNAALHAGHAFTLLKADVMARYNRNLGYNTLYPFSNHCTGIPICAAANKLKEELQSDNPNKKQYDIMKKMDIPEEEIPKFIDPKYWTEYFPRLTLERDLPSLGCAIDYRRSFITTDANPYFDSFVKWQFNKLNNKGYIKFGKKLVIYSEKDGQPCSDADRAIGEGVEIATYKIAPVVINSRNYVATFHPDAPVDSYVMSHNLEFHNCDFMDNSMIPGEVRCPEFFYKNYINNGTWDWVHTSIGNKVEKPELPTVPWSHATGIYTSNPNLSWSSYYEPESEVISRSGDRCIVAETDQWYIMYDDPEWRICVHNHVAKKVQFTDPVVREMMLDTIKNSHPWPFSRTFGMGTKIPFDEKYLIDSLSDSTIYMAFYTISHLVQKLPQDKLSDDVWESIFFEKITEISKEYSELFRKMQNEFLYWYPVDLRVSGKDLITNHLVMMMFNHLAIFGPRLMPSKIYCNGHIMVNGEKMSKNKGNFITLHQAVEKYGADVTRFICCQSGDGIVDGSFNEFEVDNAVLTIYAEVQNWARTDLLSLRNGELEFIDHLHLIVLNKIKMNTLNAYDEMKFRNVIKYGFYELQTVRNKYTNPHHDIYKLFLQLELALISPIIPHWAEYLSDLYKISYKIPVIYIDPRYSNKKMEWLYEYFMVISSKIANKLKKIKDKSKYTKCNVLINNMVQKHLGEIANYDTTDKEQRKKLLSLFRKDEIPTVIELSTHIDDFKNIFGKENIINWLTENNTELMTAYLSISYPEFIFDIGYKEIKGDPLNPQIILT